METQEQKISSTDAIVMMVNAINNDSAGDFYKVVERFANTLAFGGNNRSRIMNAVRCKPHKLRMLNELPQNVKNLLIQGKKQEENAYLIPELQGFIDVLLLEWQNAEAYKIHNIPVRNKILLHGPSGNGKTTIARHIATLINLPFVEINSDSVVDSHIGSTSSNIHNILNNIQEPCVLFWDEIDTIGSKRGGHDSAAAKENDRMVNSILINIERLNSNVIFVGATNRMEILDSAFVRRFDVKLEILAPTDRQKQLFAQQLLEYYKLADHISPHTAVQFNSYSDIKLHITELARQHLLANILTILPERICYNPSKTT